MSVRLAVFALLAASGVTVSPDAGAAGPTCEGLAATPVTLAVGAGGSTVIVGTAGPDVIVGTAGPDVIVGLGGADTICAGSGDDVVDAGDGTDLVVPGFGADVLVGGGDQDVVSYLAQVSPECTNSVIADLGAGTALATSEAWPCSEVDRFTGFEGVVGTVGDDLIDGSRGDDVLDGGPGDDAVAGQGGDDDVRGGAGDDRLAGGDFGLFVAALHTGTDVLSGGSGDDELFCVPNSGHVLRGGSGNDRIAACNRDDLVDGGSGVDVVDYSGPGATDVGGVTVDLARTNAQDTGGSGQDRIVGVEGVTGTDEPDTLLGDAKDNVLDGRGAHDVGNGRGGRDVCLNIETRTSCEA